MTEPFELRDKKAKALATHILEEWEREGLTVHDAIMIARELNRQTEELAYEIQKNTKFTASAQKTECKQSMNTK